ncbi:MAG TPA: tetratricopeptide repeat protein [Bacteroidia bacterium]|jgi:tetratricopeptide (TPR) repeat protein
MKQKLLCFLITAFFYPGHFLAQNAAVVDSLNKIVAGKAHDSIKAAALIRLAGEYYDSSPETSLKYCIAAKDLAETSNDEKGLIDAYGWIAFLFEQFGDIKAALSYNKKALVITQKLNRVKDEGTILNNMGAIYKDQGRLEDALFYHNKSLLIKMKIGDKKGMSSSYNNIGLIFLKQGKVREALNYYMRSLKIDEELKDSSGIATSLLNIGFVYKDQENYPEARTYFRKSLSLYTAAHEKYSIGFALNAFGELFKDLKNYDSAFYYYREALKVRLEVGDKQGVASTEKNLGTLHEQNGDYKKAEESYSRSLRYFEELGDKWGMAFVNNRMGQICIIKNELPKAEKYFNTSLSLSKELGYPQEISNSAGNLWKLYSGRGEWKRALDMHELHVNMRDSINNETNKKVALKNHLKYEYEKKSAADSARNAQERKVQDALFAVQDASLRQEKTLRYALFGGLILVAVFLVFIFNRFKVTQRQKQIIEAQKDQVGRAYEQLHEKNKEVMDSIYYARRIQKALITSEKYIEKNLDRLKGKKCD